MAIPVNIPLGLAIAEFIVETGVPTIAHHHDFFWERDRFNTDTAIDYFRTAFPPVHSCIQHVVINSVAGSDFARFTGSRWTLIPNVLNFKELPPVVDDYGRGLKKDIGLDDDTLMVLQPTRIVSRKGIEMSMELVKNLEPLKAALVISHEAGDEGDDYLTRIKEFADFIQVPLKIISDRIGIKRGKNKDGRKLYTLADAYLNSDLVSYPSLYEGYGNAFVEAIYFKKPIVVNRYSIFAADIEPKAFDTITFDGYFTKKKAGEIKALLESSERIAQMVEKNYMLGWRYLSYEMLEEKLEQLLINIYGT